MGNNYRLTDEEKVRVRDLLESKCLDQDGFERKFLVYIRENGPSPTTEKGAAWVKYANILGYYQEYDGETYWEHNHCPDNENNYVDNYGGYSQNIEYIRGHLDD